MLVSGLSALYFGITIGSSYVAINAYLRVATAAGVHSKGAAPSPEKSRVHDYDCVFKHASQLPQQGEQVVPKTIRTLYEALCQTRISLDE